jgi:hypothetical protein
LCSMKIQAQEETENGTEAVNELWYAKW